MRGRTNISGGITLNADIDTFSVATGNTITGGDFVEYELNNTDTVTMNATFTDDCYLIDSTNHIYIGIISDYPTLFGYENGVITVVSTYSTACTRLAKLTSSSYVVSTTDKILLLNVTANAITKIAEISGSFSRKISNIIPVGTTHFVTRSTSSGDTYYTPYTVSGSTITAGTSLDSPNSQVLGATNTQILISTPETESGTTNNVIRIYDVGSTFALSDYFTITTYNGRIGGIPNILIENRYLIASLNNRVGSTSYTYYLTLIAIDIRDKRESARVRLGQTTSATIDVLASRANSENEFLVLAPTKTYLCKLNTLPISLESSSNLDLATSSLNRAYTFDEKLYGYMIDNTGYKNLTSVTGVLAVGNPSNSVMQWTGSGNPMGVAKSSGSAGDIIEVYIPQVNS